MEGDGYTVVSHCPNADESKYEYHEPDADPVYCGEVDKEVHADFVSFQMAMQLGDFGLPIRNEIKERYDVPKASDKEMLQTLLSRMTNESGD